MGFGKFFAVFATVMIISRLTFQRLEFFEYQLFENAAAAWKLIIGLLLLGGLYVLAFFVADRFPDWCMQAKYRKRQREMEK